MACPGDTPASALLQIKVPLWVPLLARLLGHASFLVSVDSAGASEPWSVPGSVLGAGAPSQRTDGPPDLELGVLWEGGATRTGACASPSGLRLSLNLSAAAGGPRRASPRPWRGLCVRRGLLCGPMPPSRSRGPTGELPASGPGGVPRPVVPVGLSFAFQAPGGLASVPGSEPAFHCNPPNI